MRTIKWSFYLLVLSFAVNNLGLTNEVWRLEQPGVRSSEMASSWVISRDQQRMSWQQHHERLLVDFKAKRIYEWDQRFPQAVTVVDFDQAQRHGQLIQNASLSFSGFAPGMQSQTIDYDRWQLTPLTDKEGCAAPESPFSVRDQWQVTAKLCARRYEAARKLKFMVGWLQKLPQRYGKVWPQAEVLYLLTQGQLPSGYALTKVAAAKATLRSPMKKVVYRDFKQSYFRSLKLSK